MHLNLVYDYGEDIQQDLAYIERRRYVARAMVPAGYEGYFHDRARFISAHTSTAIEGNPLNAEAAQLVLIHGADADAPSEVETQNTDLAYEVIGELGLDKSLKIDQGILRSLNSLLLRGLPGRAAARRGTYRVGGSQIVDANTRNVRYNPPPPEWVPELMEDLEQNIAEWFVNDSPAVAAAKAHFALISIHPFEDGNGRTARLLADLLLHQTGWSVDGMISISSVLLAQRFEYYDALRDTQGIDFREEVDVTPFVRFHTKALARAVGDLEDKVVNFNLRKDQLTKTRPDTINIRQVIGIMYMVDLGALSSTTYSKVCNCSQPTALSDLQQLVREGHVVRLGAGKSTRYALSPQVFGGR